MKMVILGLLIAKITWSIYRLFDANNLMYYFTVEITREIILKVLTLNIFFKNVFVDNHIR